MKLFSVHPKATPLNAPQTSQAVPVASPLPTSGDEIDVAHSGN